MATYAVLGATGNCGGALIENLLPSPEVTIHAYCRSAAKLAKQFPAAVSKQRIKTFEGQIDDVELFSKCIKGCRAIFAAVTMNDNIPNVRVAQDMTHTLISALKTLREQDPNSKLPKVIVLSSASLEPSLCGNLPRLMHWVVTHCNSSVYADLRVQERLLRAEESWLTTIFVKPGGLSKDVQRGYKLSLKEQDTFISYLDLAAAMLEIADDQDGQYDMRDVTVKNVAGSAKFPKTLPLLAICGLLRHYCPWLHPYLPLFG
ncbi:hypothetical protein F5Y18DRAFT_272813 [Xylariaceae sp. FL1019]|nr:hypothetical protein F5Y18DRAFT_272813 [Xylariaceae sp. FL1019]